jgi:uncharacterized protein (TIGR03067 family)
MRACVLILILATVSVPADAPADAAKKELENLQGHWVMTSLEINGERIAAERFQNSRLEIKGDHYTINTGKGTHEAIITIDPTKNPKTIDMKLADGDNKGETAEGIYKLEGDTLTICRPRLPPRPRPTEFSTKPGTDCFLVVWKREKG